MAKRIVPSSFLCDCGYQVDFFERTVWEMEASSRRAKKPQTIGADDDRHGVIFEKGRSVAVVCPTLGRCELTD